MAFMAGYWMYAAIAASTAVSVAAAQSSANAQKQATEYNSKVAAANAAAAEQQGQAAQQAQAREAERRKGSLLAAVGASGVESDTGSPTDVMSDTVQQATLDNLTTKYNYHLKALGLQADSNLASMNAGAAEEAGAWSTASALTSGATRAYAYNTTGKLV